MSTPYIGEIRIFAGNFAPAGWAFCDGSVLAIADNDTLFNLIGTTYGGDGQTTFALPDLRGRIPLHQGTLSGGSSYPLATTGGAEAVTLTAQQMPVHSHAMTAASSPGYLDSPAGAVVAKHRDYSGFQSTGPGPTFNAQMVGGAGSSLPHENMPPFLGVSFIISLFGIFPSQT